MESDEVDNQDVIYEFKYSKVLSSFLQFIKDQVKISFFININNNNMLQFGYIKGDKKYELGYYKYTNSDISKLDSVIEKTNSAIDFKELAKGFRWCIEMAYFVKLNLAAYLNKYEGVEYYVNIVRNKFTIIIECDDSDILNISYIKRILKNGFTDHQYNRLDIEYEKIDKKDFYYITII